MDAEEVSPGKRKKIEVSDDKLMNYKHERKKPREVFQKPNRQVKVQSMNSSQVDVREKEKPGGNSRDNCEDFLVIGKSKFNKLSAFR